MATKKQSYAPIINNNRLQSNYFQVDLVCPEIAALVQPGQFVHVKLPELQHKILRRPFSVYNVDQASGTLSIIYKTVGEGTVHLSTLPPGSKLDLIGPLGKGFSLPKSNEQPIIIAGGYGAAAVYLLAARSEQPPILLLGGRNEEDLILIDQFRELGAELKLATDDGSLGHPGLITELLPETLTNETELITRLYACGPHGMLKAVSEIATDYNLTAEISLDHAMCCGVGACFACAVKVKSEDARGWTYARTCIDGPVFKSDQAIWE